MGKKQTNAIFFEDLKESAQARLIIGAMCNFFPDTYLAVRSVRIDPNLYGYDPDPAKQTVEQYLVAKIVIDRKSEGWFMVWNCFDHEFHTCTKEDELPDWFKDDDGDMTAEEKEERNRIQMEIMECNGDKLRAAKHLGYDINTFLQKIVEYNIH